MVTVIWPAVAVLIQVAAVAGVGTSARNNSAGVNDAMAVAPKRQVELVPAPTSVPVNPTAIVPPEVPVTAVTRSTNPNVNTALAGSQALRVIVEMAPPTIE